MLIAFLLPLLFRSGKIWTGGCVRLLPPSFPLWSNTTRMFPLIKRDFIRLSWIKRETLVFVNARIPPRVYFSFVSKPKLILNPARDWESKKTLEIMRVNLEFVHLEFRGNAGKNLWNLVRCRKSAKSFSLPFRPCPVGRDPEPLVGISSGWCWLELIVCLQSIRPVYRVAQS